VETPKNAPETKEMEEDSGDEDPQGMELDSDEDVESLKTLGAVLAAFKGPPDAIPKLSESDILAMVKVPRRYPPVLDEYLAHDFPEVVSRSKSTRSAKNRVCCV
jgi:hypothetical protein